MSGLRLISNLLGQIDELKARRSLLRGDPVVFVGGYNEGERIAGSQIAPVLIFLS